MRKYLLSVHPDSCGLAGGTPWGGNVPEWGEYVNTTNARSDTWQLRHVIMLHVSM